MKIIARNIKAERTRKALSQAQLAELINVSERTISQIEQNKQIPSVLKVFDIANALNISMEELFKGLL